MLRPDAADYAASGTRPRGVPSLRVGLAFALLLSACAVGPQYQKPVLDLPDTWLEVATRGVAEGEADLQTWWKVFEDPVLEGLVERAQAGNLSLAQALSRIEEARARLGVATGAKLPVVDASGQASRSQLSDNGSLGSVIPGADFSPISLFSVGVDATWEIDLYGRIRRSIEAAAAGYEASVEDYRDVLVSLLAEVASNYVSVRTLQERFAFATVNIEAQRSTLQLATDRYEGGLTSELDVRQAELNLAGSEALIPTLQAALAFSLNRLAVLLGEPPGSVHGLLRNGGSTPSVSAGVSRGLPADLLRQRPDVRRAERLLASQTALVGVATADLYPRFSLSGFFALEATRLADLPEGSSSTWGLVPGIRWNIFDRERIRNRIGVEEARTEQSYLLYEQTMLRALEDVENSFIALELERDRSALLRRAVNATERSVELVLIQYRSGLTDFQNVLDMERALFQQQDVLAVSNGQLATHLISLYKALGGGWAAAGGPVEGD